MIWKAYCAHAPRGVQDSNGGFKFRSPFAFICAAVFLFGLGLGVSNAQVFECPSPSVNVSAGYAIECRCPDGSLYGVYTGCPTSQPERQEPLCPSGTNYCADSNQCCNAGFYCSHYGCTPVGAVECGTHYCQPGQQCTSNRGCMPAGAVDCGAHSSIYCNAGSKCSSDGKRCLALNEVDCGRYSCPAGHRCASRSQGCLAPGDVDCGSYSCRAGNKCSSGGCIAQNASDCGNKTSCGAGLKCSRDHKHCFPREAVDCGTFSCNAGMKCGSGNQCLAASGVDCGGGHSCQAGNKCSNGGGCIPSGAIDCGHGVSCPAGQRCASGKQCLAKGDVDCGNGTSCGSGEKCTKAGNCVPHDAVACGQSTYCNPGTLCVGGKECLTKAEIAERAQEAARNKQEEAAERRRVIEEQKEAERQAARAKEEERQRQIAEAKARQEEARRAAELEAKQRAEETEAKRKAEAEAKQRADVARQRQQLADTTEAELVKRFKATDLNKSTISDVYTLKPTGDGQVQVAKNGKPIGTTTRSAAAQEYGFQTPSVTGFDKPVSANSGPSPLGVSKSVEFAASHTSAQLGDVVTNIDVASARGTITASVGPKAVSIDLQANVTAVHNDISYKNITYTNDMGTAEAHASGYLGVEGASLSVGASASLIKERIDDRFRVGAVKVDLYGEGTIGLDAHLDAALIPKDVKLGGALGPLGAGIELSTD